MKKKRISGLLCGLLMLTAVCGGCRQAPSSSEVSLPAVDTTPASSTTTTTTADTTTTTTTAKPTTTTTTVRVPDTTGCSGVPTTTSDIVSVPESTFEPIHFTSLEEYRQTMLTFTLIRQPGEQPGLGKLKPPASEYVTFNVRNYHMLGEKGFFLLPILPDGYTVEDIIFYGGSTHFIINLPSGGSVRLYIYHSWLRKTGANYVYIKNSRGKSIEKYSHEHISADISYSNTYRWIEESYIVEIYCYYNDPALTEHEEFVKQLTFERVNIK